MRERFIKNKRPLNLAHIYSKREKELEIKTIRRIILMSQSDDDEKRETMMHIGGES